MHAGGRALRLVALTFSAGSSAVLPEKDACPQIQSWLSVSLHYSLPTLETVSSGTVD